MDKLVCGVFRVGPVWKFYQDGRKARRFVARSNAISAAQAAVRQAIDSGMEVECYLQEPEGELHRTDPVQFTLNAPAKTAGYRTGEETPPL